MDSDGLEKDKGQTTKALGMHALVRKEVQAARETLEHLFRSSSLLGRPSSLHVFLSNLVTWFCRTGRSCVPGAAKSLSGLTQVMGQKWGGDVRKLAYAHTQKLMSFFCLRSQDVETWREGLKICEAGLSGGSGNVSQE